MFDFILVCIQKLIIKINFWTKNSKILTFLVGSSNAAYNLQNMIEMDQTGVFEVRDPKESLFTLKYFDMLKSGSLYHLPSLADHLYYREGDETHKEATKDLYQLAWTRSRDYYSLYSLGWIELHEGLKNTKKENVRRAAKKKMKALLSAGIEGKTKAFMIPLSLIGLSRLYISEVIQSLQGVLAPVVGSKGKTLEL